MKSSLLVTIMALLTGLLLMPMATFAETEQGAAGKVPISQPLVREGTLAVNLADALKLGTTSDEAQAENMLVTVGVAPRNGWISDYPVTPDIAGELRNSISDAADGKQLTMDRDEALKAFDGVMVAYDLSMRPSDPEQVEGNAPSYTPDTTVINNYYYDEGPPVVTYYAPPPDYYYLYSWVPYPFWWWNSWFPGFFVLADFTFVIDGHGHHRHHDGFHHDGFRGHNEFVSNHFRDPGTGRMSRIDPAHRANGGTFADRGGAGWSSPSARNGAQAIFNRSQNVATAGRSGIVRPAGNGTVSGQSLKNRTMSSPYGARGTISRSSAPTGRTSGSPSVTRGTSVPYSGDRMVNSPSVGRRTFSPPSGGGRTFTAPSAVGRSFSQPSVSSRSFAPSYGGSRSFSAPSVGRSLSAPSVGRSFGGSSGAGRSLGSMGGAFGGSRR